VNGTLLKKESLDGTKGNALFDLEYTLPDEMLNTTLLEIKFAAQKGSRMPRVFYLRLMK
jgi:hypothetical protein